MMTEPQLQSRIDAALARTLDWLDTMQAPALPKGVSRISAAHDIVAWPGMLLPGTYNAVMARALLGGSANASAAHWLLKHRRADGVFRVPGMTDDTVYKKPDPAETWRYIDFHVTNYSLGAVQALAPDVLPVLDFAKPWLDLTHLKAWLADRDLRDPWQEGNNIVNLASFMLGMGEHGDSETRTQVNACMHTMFDWHDRLQEPATGFWGVGQLSDPVCALHAMAGSMHNYHLWYALDRTLPHQDKAVDWSLAQPPRIHSACIDVDLVDLLVHAHDLIDHRRSDIRAWLHTLLLHLLDFQNDDGGFADLREGIRRQDGWVRGYTEPQGLSNTFATWFRWIAIAMIDDCLWPGRRAWGFRRGIGIGYRKALAR